MNIASQGGAGQETTLIVRGADKKYVKTLWNGIDLSDTSAPQVQVPRRFQCSDANVMPHHDEIQVGDSTEQQHSA